MNTDPIAAVPVSGVRCAGDQKHLKASGLP
jgi:hypothetical protein